MKCCDFMNMYDTHTEAIYTPYTHHGLVMDWAPHFVRIDVKWSCASLVCPSNANGYAIQIIHLFAMQKDSIDTCRPTHAHTHTPTQQDTLGVGRFHSHCSGTLGSGGSPTTQPHSYPSYMSILSNISGVGSMATSAFVSAHFDRNATSSDTQIE